MGVTRTVCAGMVGALLFPSCGPGSQQRGPAEWMGRIEIRDGLTVVRNPAEPLLGELTLQLDEDLIVGDTLHEESFFFFLIQAAVDDGGNLFIWDPNSYRIQVFDADGRYLRTVGRRGRGPGEFSEDALQFHVGVRGELAVLDAGRLQFFDPSGEYTRELAMPPMSPGFVVLANGGVLLEQMSSDADGPLETIALAGEPGHTIQTLASYRSEKWHGAFIDRLRFTHLAPELVLAPWGSGGGVFGYPATYEVTVIDGKGRAARVFQVEEPPLEVSSQLEDALIEDMSSDAPRMSVRDLEGEVYIPETWPFFDALLSDEKGNLLVQRSEPLPSPTAGRKLDFFTAEGLFLYRLRVATDDIQAVRNGFLYAQRFDRDMNVAQLVRYRILNWGAITEAADRHRLPSIRPSAPVSTRSPAP